MLGGAVGSLFLGLRADDGSLLMPLTALQILWINFLGDGPPALALSVDRSPGVMQERPRPPKSPLLDSSALRFILLDGGFKGVVGLALLALMPALGASLATTATSVFLYESVAKLVSAYPARKIGAPAAPNLWLHVSIAAGLLVALLCLVVPALRLTLGLSALDGTASATLAIAIAVTALSGELIARALRGGSPMQDLQRRAA